MVHLYVAEIRNLPEPMQCKDIISLFPLERQEKIKNCVRVEAKMQCFATGLLLEYVFQKYGLKTQDIKKGAFGKPEADGIYFNLSHSDGLVLCVVGDKKVGCDVEAVKEAPKRLAERFFSVGEQQYLLQFRGKLYDEQFFRVWTAKESYIKMTGEGMHLPMQAYEINLAHEITVYRDEIMQECSLKEYRRDEYQITVCSEDTVFSEEIQVVDLSKEFEI